MFLVQIPHEKNAILKGVCALAHYKILTFSDCGVAMRDVAYLSWWRSAYICALQWCALFTTG